jgi:hypothetical protein
MQPSEEEMERLWRQANEGASSRGFLVFPGSISLEGPMAMWSADEGIAQFLDMAGALGKRILYMKSRKLGPDELIDAVAVALSGAIEALDATTPEQFLREAGVMTEPEARDYLKFGKEHYGQRMDVNVEWVHEGVVHRFWKHADWHGQLLDKATSVAELIESGEDD